jgi:hypothetical protein
MKFPGEYGESLPTPFKKNPYCTIKKYQCKFFQPHTVVGKLEMSVIAQKKKIVTVAIHIFSKHWGV